MKTTILAVLTAVGLAFGSTAVASDFEATELTISAQHGILSFTVEGSADTGYESVAVGAEVLSFNVAGNLNSTVDVFGTYYRTGDEFGIGAAAGLTYDLGSLAVYGTGELEYLTKAEVFMVTPTIGTSYTVNSAIGVFAEVGYTWNASDSWSREGGLAEVGVNVSLANNVTLTPSLRHRFDVSGVDNNTQAHIGLAFNF